MHLKLFDLDKKDITQILNHYKGETDAARLYPLVYDNLHEIAEKLFARERKNHTLQPTLLVNEAYMNLVDASQVVWYSRSHFFAVGAKAIRRILIHHAREKNAQKRGGGLQQIDLEEGIARADQKGEALLHLDEAIEFLAQQNERQAQVVELKFFGGLKMKEIADELGVSIKTVELDWRIAKAWLKNFMESDV